MKTFFIVLIIILAVIVGALIALYFVGKKMQKKQEANQASIDAAAQTMNFFIIDMKKMKLSEAGLRRGRSAGPAGPKASNRLPTRS